MTLANVLHRLPYPRGSLSQPGNPVDDVDYQPVSVHLVAHQHVEGCRRGALLDVAAYVKLVVAAAAIGQTVNQPRVTVVGEDHRPVGGEDRVVLAVAHAVWVQALRLQPHQVDDVDHPHHQFRDVLPQDGRRREDLQSRRVTGASEHHVGFGVVGFGARPLPDPGTARAVQRGGVGVQPVECGVLSGHHHVDVVGAAQDMVGHAQQ